ncbi:MAG: 30S ribosome-binding factor RbfA [Candidatus Omnitrophota bacterium]
MRAERVGQEIKRLISEIIRDEIRDPRIGFITITDVELSKDLRDANVYFSVLGSKEQEKKSIEGINQASAFIRKLIGERIKLRFNPQLKFKLDRSIAYGMKIEKMLKEIKDEKKK